MKWKQPEPPTTRELVKMGYWKFFANHQNHVLIVKRIKYKELKGALITIASVAPTVVLLIVLPFIETWRHLARAKYELERETLALAVMQSCEYRQCWLNERKPAGAGYYITIFYPRWIYEEDFV